MYRELAVAPMVGFEVLSDDRQVQRTRFETDEGEVSVTVNFGGETTEGIPARSAVVRGGVFGVRRYFVD